MRVLHVGCGRGELPIWFSGCDETRLDIDPDVEPDIVASMTDLGSIGPFDAVVSQHNLEHLYPHEVGQALAEFRRVLTPSGFVWIMVPDLEGVAATDDVLFEAEAGPISGLDLIYGHRAELAERPYMAHHTGFTKSGMEQALQDFPFVFVSRHPSHNLFALAFNGTPDAGFLKLLRASP